MDGKIQVNATELLGSATQVQNVVDGIDVKLDTWTSQGEQSISLEAYAQQFYELEKAVQLFCTLLTKDMDSVNAIGREFFVTDNKLAKLWEPK